MFTHTDTARVQVTLSHCEALPYVFTSHYWYTRLFEQLHSQPCLTCGRCWTFTCADKFTGVKFTKHAKKNCAEKGGGGGGQKSGFFGGKKNVPEVALEGHFRAQKWPRKGGTTFEAPEVPKTVGKLTKGRQTLYFTTQSYTGAGVRVKWCAQLSTKTVCFVE